MGIDGLPLAPTWPKKAKQLAKKGRADWVDDGTIRLLVGLPEEMRATDMSDETIAHNERDEQDKAVNDTHMVPNRDIEVGDVVCINSGGPGMTVMELRDDGQALCKWWEARGGYSQEWLPLKVIRRKEPQKG